MKLLKSKVASNTIMLYGMSIAKLIFPMLTFPYLTRVLSEETYGFVSYVKNCMTYMQLVIDFGFILSSVKCIVNADGDIRKIGYIVGDTFLSKLILSLAAALVLVGMYCTIGVLRINTMFVVLSFVAVLTSAFLADFFFRGIEKMHYITIIYVITKGISTALTIVLVRGDATVMWIPLLDIVANLIAVGITVGIILKMKIPVKVSNIRNCWLMIKDSFTYFLSTIATTAFAALNTVLIGKYYENDIAQVAYWSVCMSIISAIQGLYSPICNSVYPHMIKEKSLQFIHKIMCIFMPVVTVGCIFSFFMAKTALLIVGGEKYIGAYGLFRWMIPVLFFSFPAQVYGWPTLGAIGKVKETTASTMIAAAAQIAGLVVLYLTNNFTLVAIAILRFSTEALMMTIRMYITYKNRDCFRTELIRNE